MKVLTFRQVRLVDRRRKCVGSDVLFYFFLRTYSEKSIRLASSYVRICVDGWIDGLSRMENKHIIEIAPQSICGLCLYGMLCERPIAIVA